MIQNFIRRLYPTKRHKISLLGLDSAGKTTLLYQLKLQQVVQTIPTIGFNVEDIDVHTTSGVFSATCWDLGTGCGSTYMIPLLKNMVSTSDGVVWLVDSANESYLEESVEAFKTIFAGSDGLAMDMPTLILATKKDLPNIVSVDTIRTMFAEALKGRPSFVVSSSLIQDITTNKEIQTAFGWMQLMLNSSHPDRFSSPLFPVSVETPNEKLESWLTRLDTDTSSEVFLSQFNAIELPSWDHYIHIRIAYVLLITYGRQKDEVIGLVTMSQANSVRGAQKT
ncbi:hypothetical protein VNI00_008472 [Paramarasmius palmivorus]|uniref:Uncharacterized protein n=1 Tax=Paramarasmius palmivorus TaxID=297713 RepID=A0AAW0CVW3_9AGAR